MIQTIRAYAAWVIRHRIAVMAGNLAVTAFLAFQMGHLVIENTPDLWAPDDHAFIKATRLIERVFGGRNFTVIGIVPKSGDAYQPAVLAKIRNVQDRIVALPQAVRQNVLSLAAEKAKAITGVEGGMDVHPLMERIPSSAQEVERLKGDVERNPIYQKAVISPDGKAAAVIADFKLDKDNTNYTPLFEAIQDIADSQRDDTVDVYVGGLPVDLGWMEYYIMQMPYYFAGALLIIVAIQYSSFRSLQGMFLPTVTALLSVVWALGLMGLKGYRVDAMNMNTPILIMAVTAGHAIQILKRYYEEYWRLAGDGDARSEQVNNAAIVESIAQVGPIMIMAGLIAVAVFLSLKFSDIEMTRRFGELAATGILAGLIQEMTLIPTLRSMLPPPKSASRMVERRSSLLDRLLLRLSRTLVERRAGAIFLASLAIVMVAFSGITRLRQDNSLKQFYVESTRIRTDDAELNRHFGGTNSMIFLVEGDREDSLKEPGVLRGMEALQSFLDAQPGVGKTQSLADLVKRMNRAMHDDDPQQDAIPPSRNLVAQYLLLYSSSGNPQDFDNLVDRDYRRGVIWVFLKDDSTAYASELYRRAQGVIAASFPAGVEVRLGGSLPQVIAINTVVIEEKLRNILQMGAILFVLSALVLRSFVGGLFVVTPLVAVVMANFGFMGWAGIPLNVGTALTASLAVAIGADYELYLMFRLKEELRRGKSLLAAMQDSYLSAGKAVVLAAISVAGGYSILLLSDCRFYTWFSSVVIVTMAVSALSTIVLLRSMMIVFKPRFIFGASGQQLFASPDLDPPADALATPAASETRS